MDRSIVLKAIADETRMKILTLLLKRNYCVRALARRLELSEAAISQHLKLLREAGLLIGEKRGYFIHYDVERSILYELAGELEALAAIEREACTPETGACKPNEYEKCHVRGDSKGAGQEFCHGRAHGKDRCGRHKNCQGHNSKDR